MQDKDVKKSRVEGSNEGGDTAHLRDDRMERALQLANSSAAHRAAFDTDPVGYLQNLGVDTRHAPKKLSLQKQTLAKVSAGETRAFTLDTITLTTVTVTTPQPPITATITATCSITINGPNTLPPGTSITATVQTAAP